MTSDDPSPATRVRRLDDRLGLALLRVSLPPRSLVTLARDHVLVRTPSRPDFHDGNTLDLAAPPQPGSLARWMRRFGETVGRVGATRVRLRWEEPADPAACARPSLPTALAEEAAGLGLELEPLAALLLHELAPPREVDADLVAVGPPSADGAGHVERQWYASTVLSRYEHGETPDQWREHDDDFERWRADVDRELAAAGRARLWLALRHGMPVGRLVLAHDRQGLAVVEDVVVHPVHRRLGIAGALTRRAVVDHLEERPGDRVGIVAVAASPAERLYRRLGFRPHATLWVATGPPAPGS